MILTAHFLPLHYDKYLSTISSNILTSQQSQTIQQQQQNVNQIQHSYPSSVSSPPLHHHQQQQQQDRQYQTYSPSITSSSCSSSSFQQQQHPPLSSQPQEHTKLQFQSNRLHHAVAKRNFDHIDTILKGSDFHQVINERDENGWQPLHEAIRTGDLEICHYLINSGADINTCTNNGGTPLWWAKQFHPINHELVCYLKDIGAPERVEFRSNYNNKLEEYFE